MAGSAACRRRRAGSSSSAISTDSSSAMRRRRTSTCSAAPDDRGQVGAVHQRQRRELDEHGDVVRVAHEPVRAGRSPRRAASSARRARSSASPACAITQKRSSVGQRPPAPAPGRRPPRRTGGARATTSSAAPTSTPVCSATIAPKTGSGSGAAPRRGQRPLVAARQAHLDEAAGARPRRTRTRKKAVEVIGVISSTRAAASRSTGPGPNAASMPCAPGRRLALGRATRAARTAPRRSTGCRSRAALPRRLGVVAPQAAAPPRRRPGSSARPGGARSRRARRASSPRRAASVRTRRAISLLSSAGHVLGQHRVEAVVVQVEAERVGRAREQVRQRLEDAHARRTGGASPPARRRAPRPPPRRRTARSTPGWPATGRRAAGSGWAARRPPPARAPRGSRPGSRARAPAPPRRPTQPSAVIGSRRTSARKPSSLTR